MIPLSLKRCLVAFSQCPEGQCRKCHHIRSRISTLSRVFTAYCRSIMDKCCIGPKNLIQSGQSFLQSAQDSFLGHPVSPWVPLQFTILCKSASLRLTYCSNGLKKQSCPVIRNVPFTSFTLIYHFLTNAQSMVHLNRVKWFNLSVLIRILFWRLSLKYLWDFAKSYASRI